MKHNFYVTFGTQYPDRVIHPTYARAHRDGWVRIVADSYEQARMKAFDMFGQHFATIRTDYDWKPEYFPMGEIECVEV
jgi:hypothetical protein